MADDINNAADNTGNGINILTENQRFLIDEHIADHTSGSTGNATHDNRHPERVAHIQGLFDSDDVLIRLNKELIPDIVTYNYAGALKLADQVVEPVNKFFDSVMVMDENVDIKNNRLALLEQAKEVTNAVGDLSCIVL